MLTSICEHLRNFFEREICAGTFTIEGGKLSLPFVQDGQYFRIIGSVFNDGIHQAPAPMLTDETFNGQVWALAIPAELVKLASEIEEWQSKNGDVSPYQSESFGGYSYSRANDASGNAITTWQAAFRNRLNKWRKL